MTDKTPVIQLKEVKKTFGSGHQQVDALKSTNFVANRGELIAIIGPSGSGKSTFLTIVGGLQSPSSGKIIMNDQDITKCSDRERAAMRLHQIGFVLQASNLIPFLTVDQQMALLDKVKQGNMTSNEKAELFEELAITELAKKYPSDLSGGERQRVAIAKALYSNPSLLLADEPTASLDSERAFEVMNRLKNETVRKNITTLVVTHDTRLIKYFDRVFKMTDGILKEESIKE